MTLYYKNGFYDDSHGGFVPEGACEISAETYRLLLEGQAQGKLIIADDEGNPILSEPPPIPIEEQRQKIRDAINALRDKKINGGVYVPAIDKWIDTDATAERNILSVKATFDLFGDQEIPWTFADNSVAMINKEKLLVIWQVLMEAKTGNHANALKHKAMVEQVENPLEYDYSDGWTQTYEEFAGAANE
ncbi:DUF4376 domain-containing protein [Glaesserella parasuis]|uniref:DUF4376 domain-containing protein n=3 Tax=Glaesserella parasuis TaxID=738 RepID=UPI0024366784|nr:DUF4376 domain-containing protein [Glaesserella parasuis]MDG6785943.1 DUF4376 domain-containing protein [Glaesserella parasuis]MDO9898616.1 DUF4376 domain-containing protein [Glaesserella parasuis]MDO9936118.1 DUF4376 domain-containing protein [Glaesserella parasuis]MDP0040162.1 DUF4376 domain-containing protein [Glaesserella parasuis]MDP0082588.1 DUF4376 domain-containing protein [Glaesserella parasuis]